MARFEGGMGELRAAHLGGAPAAEVEQRKVRDVEALFGEAERRSRRSGGGTSSFSGPSPSCCARVSRRC